MSHINKIIIIGTNHHNTLSMVRCFGEEGRKVSLFIYGDEQSYIASSIYVSEVSFFPTALDAIEAIPFDGSHKPLIIACSDEVSSLMDLQYNNLIQKCYFFNAGETGRITAFMDKQKQINIANECGFSIPASIDTLPCNVDYSHVNYPCFVKPKASIHGGKKISICRNEKELRTCLNKYDPQFNVLIQDYIKKDYEIVVLGVTLGELTIIPGFIKKHREECGGTTYSTVLPFAELNHSIVDACKRLIQTTKYQGLWGIECIKKGDDYYFLELNMRNDATTYAMKVAGVNLPLLYLQLIENPETPICINPIRPINSIVEFNDFNFVLKGKVGLFRWIREYRHAECKYYHSTQDCSPYNERKKDYIRFLRNRIFGF